MATDLKTLFGSASQLAGSFINANSILTGGAIQAQGQRITAQSLRNAARSLQDSTMFNLRIDEINTTRRLSALSRQAQRTFGLQQLQAARSGFALGSKSNIILQNEAASAFEKSILNTKIDAENTRRARIFQRDARAAALENQARTAEFRAQTAEFQARTGAVRSIGQGIGSVASNLLR